MTQDDRDCIDTNSAFEKLKITSEENDKKMSYKLHIPKPKVFLAIDKILEKKKRLDTDSVYGFIVCNCACNMTKAFMTIKTLIMINFKRT